MRQTTLRFSEDLWATLEREARDSGVSVAQYVREAAISRIAYDAGRRGDPQYETTADQFIRHAREVGERAEDQREGSLALLRQSRLARQRSQALRSQRST
jgi:hypothetical protein